MGAGAKLTGVRFTSRGSGAQWENTASAAMGVGLYKAPRGEKVPVALEAPERRPSSDAATHERSARGFRDAPSRVRALPGGARTTLETRSKNDARDELR